VAKIIFDPVAMHLSPTFLSAVARIPTAPVRLVERLLGLDPYSNNTADSGTGYGALKPEQSLAMDLWVTLLGFGTWMFRGGFRRRRR
jgi:hypothetical protein